MIVVRVAVSDMNAGEVYEAEFSCEDTALPDAQDALTWAAFRTVLNELYALLFQHAMTAREQARIAERVVGPMRDEIVKDAERKFKRSMGEDKGGE